MSDQYILDGHTPVPCDDLHAWARWFQKGDARRVAQTTVGNASVSTVFLGLDHRFGDDGPPLLFETMIFGNGDAEYQERCSTWEEAEAMHARAVLALTQRVVEDSEHRRSE